MPILRLSASGRAACQEVDLCGGVARPDNEPQYITDFYFYIGIASLSMDFQQPVRVMALRLRRAHPSKKKFLPTAAVLCLLRDALERPIRALLRRFTAKFAAPVPRARQPR